jgi:glycerophosphoryl diester phosphodiesterase
LELGAGIECDLRLTADNQVVVFHDADATRLCGSPLIISRNDWKELSRLRVGEHPIPTLQSVLGLVAGRVPLLIEVKVEDDLWRWAPALKAALADYRERFGVMSFDPRLVRLLKTNMPDVRRGLVVRDTTSPLGRRLAMLLGDPEFVAIERTLLAKTWVARTRRKMPVYGWTVASVEQRAQASVHADTLIWEGDGRPRI